MRWQKTESALVRSLEQDSLLMDRVERLMIIPAVGPTTALSWKSAYRKLSDYPPTDALDKN